MIIVVQGGTLLLGESVVVLGLVGWSENGSTCLNMLLSMLDVHMWLSFHTLI